MPEPDRKIIYFHHGMGPGGAPRSLAMLISELDSNKYESIVVLPDRPGNRDVISFFSEAGASVLPMKGIRPFNGSAVAPCKTIKDRAYALLSFNKTARTAAELVSKYQPDIVHLNSTCLVAAAKGVKSVDSSIPTIAHVREPLLTNWWGRILARMNRKYVDFFVGIDQYGLDSVNAETSKGTVIRNFVNRDKYKPNKARAAEFRSARNWSEQDVVFLSLSRVMQHNGIRELLQLVRECHKDLDPNAKFVIAGFHPQESQTEYEREMRGSITSDCRCEAIGFVSDVIPLLDAADVIIAPFTTPHSARSVFEGFALGKPAIVSQQPNLQELVREGETGYCISLGSAKEFIRSVNVLCDQANRDRMRVSCLDWARAEFDQVENAAKTERVYQELLNR